MPLLSPASAFTSYASAATSSALSSFPMSRYTEANAHRQRPCWESESVSWAVATASWSVDTALSNCFRSEYVWASACSRASSCCLSPELRATETASSRLFEASCREPAATCALDMICRADASSFWLFFLRTSESPSFAALTASPGWFFLRKAPTTRKAASLVAFVESASCARDRAACGFPCCMNTLAMAHDSIACLFLSPSSFHRASASSAFSKAASLALSSIWAHPMVCKAIASSFLSPMSFATARASVATRRASSGSCSLMCMLARQFSAAASSFGLPEPPSVAAAFAAHASALVRPFVPAAVQFTLASASIMAASPCSSEDALKASSSFSAVASASSALAPDLSAFSACPLTSTSSAWRNSALSFDPLRAATAFVASSIAASASSSSSLAMADVSSFAMASAKRPRPHLSWRLRRT
mmetsp:Transcript_8117/g.22863  ORF Transcript_8117/g.22863 Transcript_8117/m.22863 type:complete len:419 (+) Transcript_8117:324-1580(+)